MDGAVLATEAGAAARLAHPDHPITIEAVGPLLVRADPLAISRILGNLLDNAAAYSPKERGSGCQRVGTAATPSSPSRIKAPGFHRPIATGSSSGTPA